VGSADDDPDMQRQIDELVALLATNTARIDSLQNRADASEARADIAEQRADVSEQRADEMQAESLVDREMIAEMQADGVLSRDHVAQLEKALISSRVIGAAVGILMASRQVNQDRAFEMLSEASQRSNRKLRDLAADLVETANRGDLLP
jgi:hypothetical protein